VFYDGRDGLPLLADSAFYSAIFEKVYLDRLGRSLKDVLTIADDLHERGTGVKILTGKLSGTYSPTGEGKFFFTMMAAFAELERDMIYERTRAGLVAARAQGRNGGRPTLMDPGRLAVARARRARGESPAQIARALGVSRASVYRHLGAAGQAGEGFTSVPLSLRPDEATGGAGS
jgi:DNA invertase Pin-like site-specific DNA recombinase